jgi:hypothetical protein
MRKTKIVKTFILTVSSLLIFSTNVFAETLDDGIKLFKSGQYEKAIEVLNKVVKEDQFNPQPHFWLAKCYDATFQIENSLQETKIYQTLMYNNPKHKEKTVTPKEVKKEEVVENEPDRLNRLDDDYLSNLINRRDNAEEVKNLKFIDLKTINKLLSEVPLESDSLLKMNREYEIKAHYGLASHESLIILNKTRLELALLNIDTKKFEMTQEKDSDKKKAIEQDIISLQKDYNKTLEDTSKLINTAVFTNTDPMSFEYYQSLETTPDEHIKRLETKKRELKIAIDAATQQIKNFKSIIIPQEKELNLKKEKIDPKLLDADISSLSGYEKEVVISYKNLGNKIDNDKARLLNYVLEQEILFSAFDKANETIKKIKPEYIFNDPPLPKQEKLKELK